MGLNPAYDTIRGNILMMQPLPSINQAYALLIQDEKQKEIHPTTQSFSETAAMHVQTQFQGNFNQKSGDSKKLVCDHCKKPGHAVNKCYRLIGFPKDFKFTKLKRFAASAMSEQVNDSGVHAMSAGTSLTVDQCQQLIEFLQNTHLTNTSSGNSSQAPDFTTLRSANFAGPFSEEATGSW